MSAEYPWSRPDYLRFALSRSARRENLRLAAAADSVAERVRLLSDARLRLQEMGFAEPVVARIDSAIKRWEDLADEYRAESREAEAAAVLTEALVRLMPEKVRRSLFKRPLLSDPRYVLSESDRKQLAGLMKDLAKRRDDTREERGQQ